jgi:hypothetical protein
MERIYSVAHNAIVERSMKVVIAGQEKEIPEKHLG